jgi:hypothetical protein
VRAKTSARRTATFDFKRVRRGRDSNPRVAVLQTAALASSPPRQMREDRYLQLDLQCRQMSLANAGICRPRRLSQASEPRPQLRRSRRPGKDALLVFAFR